MRYVLMYAYKAVKIVSAIVSDLFRSNSSVRIFYYPAIPKKSNPYQHLLYSHLPETFAASFGLPEAALIAKWLRPEKIVVFHLHWIFSIRHEPEKILRKLERLKKAGVIIVWTVHNVFEHDSTDRANETIFREKLGSIADIMHIHAESDKKLLGDCYYIAPEKYTVAPHGNYVGIYQNTRSSSECREALQIAADDIVFLFFGMIRPYKGLEELIEAFAKLQEEYPKALLLIVGKITNFPDGHNIIRHSVSSRIRIIEGFVKNDHVQNYMNAADFCVFPYKNILTSGSALLALSFGKPVIAPSIGSLPSLIEQDKDGFLYPADAKDALLSTLSQAASVNRDSRIAMSQAAHRKAAMYPWEKTSTILADAILAKAGM